MPSFLLLALLVLNGCLALSAPRPGSFEALGVRQYLESISNSTDKTMSKATIMAVELSTDKQTYYTIVSLGNMSFRVALDTGSSDFWLLSSACTTSTCSAVPRYQLGYQSSTFQSVNDNQTLFNVSFLDTTTASGFIARETVIMNNLTVPQQAFGLMNSSNVTFSDEISGILGLGFPRLSTIYSTIANATPIFATMAQNGQLDYPLFGLSLEPNTTGSLTLGAIDATVVTNRSLIEWNEVNPFAPFNGTNGTTASYLQWAIELSQIYVNGSGITPLPTYPQAASNHSLALLDVGTSGIYGPYQDVKRIFDAIDGARLIDEDGQWAMPCDTSVTLGFSFGGTNYTMQPTDYLIGPTAEDSFLCLTWPAALSPSSDGIDWQLGTPFLQTVYSIFSLGIDAKEAPMIGLYPLRNASAPVQSPSVVSAYFSSVSATVDATIPNSLLPTPTYTTPPYIFNTSVTAPPGLIVSSGLATSSYSPVLGGVSVNATAIPTLDPPPTLFTFVVTESGTVSTSVSTASQPSITLGEPPGWSSSADAVRVSLRAVLFSICALMLSLVSS